MDVFINETQLAHPAQDILLAQAGTFGIDHRIEG